MTIKVEMSGNRIILRSSRALKNLHKRIPGAYFAKTGGAHWTLPLNMDTCRALRRVFKKELDIGPELSAWAFARRDKENLLAEIGKSLEGELAGDWGQLYPDLWEAVTQSRPYQAAGIDFIVKGRDVIVADTVGLGKTVQTLGAVQESELPGPYLVVCPKTPVMTVWVPEILRWLPGYTVWFPPEGKESRNKVLDSFLQMRDDKSFLVVNQDMLRTRSYWVCYNKVDGEKCGVKTVVKQGKKELDCEHDPKRSRVVTDHEFPQLFKVEWSIIVADESDKCLLKQNKTSTQTRRGMEMLKIRENGIKIAQSATPWRSRPHLLWSTLNWLMPNEYTSFWAWVETLYEVEKNDFGVKEIGKLNPKREKILYKALSTIMLRRTRQEVAAYLPRRQYIGTPHIPADKNSLFGVWIPMEPEQERAYREMESEAAAEIEGGEVDAIGALAELTRLAQFATCYGKLVEDNKVVPILPSNKFSYLVQMLHDLGFPHDPQTKVVVVSRFTSVLELFAKELKKREKIDSLMITGRVSGNKRAEAVKRFNDPDSAPHLLFMNTQAGGSAITLDAADEMVFLDETYVADDQEQCEGRIDNRRPEEKIVQRRYRYLRSIDTIELGIGEVNRASSEEDRRLLDERRGVQYVIDVLEASLWQNKKTG